MSQLWERRHRRIDYQADVRLVPTEGEGAIFGQALNLSTMGMYVAAESLCAVGTEVYCDIPVGQNWVRLRGRVAWLRTNDAHGMGVEFLDLDERAFELLGSVVGTSFQSGERVKVWFDGMSHPIRADAVRTDEGICLRTALPFLRLNSNVAFAFSEDEQTQQHAAVRNVALRPGDDDAVPRLHVDLVCFDSESKALALERARQHEGEHPSHALELTAELPPSGGDSDLVLGATPAEVEFEPAQPALEGVVSGQTDEPIVQVAEAQAWTAVDTVRVCTPFGTGAAIPLTRLKRETRREPGPDEPYLEVVFDDDLLSSDELDDSQWSFSDEPNGERSEHSEFWQRSGPSLRSVLLWLAAFAMAGIAVASAHHTGLFERAYDRLRVWFDRSPDSRRANVRQRRPERSTQALKPTRAAPGAATPADPRTTRSNAEVANKIASAAVVSGKAAVNAQKADRVPSAAVATPAVQQPAKGKGVAFGSAAAPQRKRHRRGSVDSSRGDGSTRRVARKPPVAGRLKVKTINGRLQLDVPISGSQAGKRRYPLSDPNGWVVRLPAGKIGLAPGDYVIKRGPLRLLWVRNSRKYGPQLRLMLSRSARGCDARIAARHVRFSCPIDQ